MAKYGFCSFKPQNFALSTCFQFLYEQYLDLTSTASIFTNFLLAQFNQTEILTKYLLSSLSVTSYSSTNHMTRSFLIVKAVWSPTVQGLILISGSIPAAVPSKARVSAAARLLGLRFRIPPEA